MPKFLVRVPFLVYVRIPVDFAIDKDDAIDRAHETIQEEDIRLDNYVGNGGTDRLVGCNDSDYALEPCEEPEHEGEWVEGLDEPGDVDTEVLPE